MKNIIAITSLLAAGTALANATDIPVPSFTFEGNTTLTSTGSWTSTSGEIGYYTPTSTVYWRSPTGATGLIAKIGGNTDAQTASLSAWVKFDDLSTAGNLFTVASRDNADVSNNYGYQLVVGNDGALSVSKTGNSTGMLGTITEGVWTHIALVVTKSGSARTATADLYLDGVLASGSVADNVFGTNFDGDGLSRLTLSTATSGFSFADFKVFQGTALTAEQVGALYSASSPIPEPSAFGLLAGLGALALAGTRRRRRKA